LRSSQPTAKWSGKVSKAIKGLCPSIFFLKKHNNEAAELSVSAYSYSRFDPAYCVVFCPDIHREQDNCLFSGCHPAFY